MKAKGVSGSKASALANIVYLSSSSNKNISNRAPSDYLKKLLDSHGDQARSWLNSNLIYDNAIEAALEDNYDEFLKERAQSINAEAIKLAGWK